MTAGKKLKKQLGLDKILVVKISRILELPKPTYLVWYDSHRPTYPITTYTVKKFPSVTSVYRGIKGFKKPIRFTPPYLIEDFDGSLRTGTFIAIDLCGRFLINKKVLESKVKPNKPVIITKLKEFVTMTDLMDKGNISDFSMDFRKDRSTIMGGENTTAKLLDVFLNKADDSVTFLFQAQATKYKDIPNQKLKKPSADRYKKDKQRVQPLNLSLINNPEKTYEIQIKVLEFFSWLDAQKAGLEKITSNLIKEVMEVSNIQLFSSSPSFQFQGMNYWLTQIDASIYPEDRKPKRWDAYHGENYFLDKHLYGLIRQMKFYYNPMASMLTKKLKKQEYLE